MPITVNYSIITVNKVNSKSTIQLSEFLSFFYMKLLYSYNTIKENKNNIL